MKEKRIIGLLFIVAFTVPMWFNGLAFGSNHNRFELVMNDSAVLDNETGLVWERSPGMSTMDWFNAIKHCYNKPVGGRKGWRLPTIEELTGLIDMTALSAPFIPDGHPFVGVQSSFYWTITTDAGDILNAVGVDFNDGLVGIHAKSDSAFSLVWCVRGGQGYDGAH